MVASIPLELDVTSRSYECLIATAVVALVACKPQQPPRVVADAPSEAPPSEASQTEAAPSEASSPSEAPEGAEPEGAEPEPAEPEPAAPIRDVLLGTLDVPPDGSAPRCGKLPTLHRFDVPAYALENTNAYAGEFDWGVVVMHGELKRERRPKPGQLAEFRGALYEYGSKTWVDLPPPPTSLISGGLDAAFHYVRIGDRIAVLMDSSSPAYGRAAVNTATAIFDTAARTWTDVPQDHAPPRQAYRVGPWRAASTDRFWVWWPSHERGSNYAAGHALDISAGTWIETEPTDAPSTRAAARPLPANNQLLVIPTRSAEAGIYDPASNRWDPFAVPVGNDVDGHAGVAVSDDGRLAALVLFDETQDHKRSVTAFLIDLTSKTVEALPDPGVLLDHAPNTEMIFVDARRLIVLDDKTMHVFDRKANKWTSKAMPASGLTSSGGSLVHLCGGRITIEREPWVLHVDELSWRPLKWPSKAPQEALRQVYGSDRVLMLGDLSTPTRGDGSCPPGAACLAPDTTRVQITSSFRVPLESGRKP